MRVSLSSEAEMEAETDASRVPEQEGVFDGLGGVLTLIGGSVACAASDAAFCVVRRGLILAYFLDGGRGCGEEELKRVGGEHVSITISLDGRRSLTERWFYDDDLLRRAPERLHLRH